MGIFNWIQQKVTPKPVQKKPAITEAFINLYQPNKASDQGAIHSEEHSNWPHGLLTIGTFGNFDEKHEQNQESEASCIPELSEFTLEEVGKLQKELTRYLALKHSRRMEVDGSNNNDCPLNKFLNCPSSLEVDRSSSLRLAKELAGMCEDPEICSVLANRRKGTCTESRNSNIPQKGFTFLLKKMFACRGGFGPQPGLRDPPFLESRMEKLLKVVLNSKILYPQNSASCKKFIRTISTTAKTEPEESSSGNSDRYKWDKTDSDFIVLEM